MSDTIETLEIEVIGSSQSAVQSLDALEASLSNLKIATKGGCGLRAVANQLSAMNTALDGMDASKVTNLSGLATALEALSKLGKFKLSSSIANQISNLGTAIRGLDDADFRKLDSLASSLTSLSSVGKINLNASNLRKLLNSTDQIPTSNRKAALSYANLAGKVSLAYVGMKRGVSTIGNWINLSNQYIENMNLFNVSMGQYAEEASEYANTVENLMGIDPGEWMRNQAVFMSLATGFGVVNDRAYTMSQNLTQLGYDLSSFFNITYEDAMTKLQSGISGELEPLRRLGYDLSNAKLEAVALSLGIDKSVSSMTQAEKAELRYYAIMTQVTKAQGDMARTLNDPANQLRVFRSQLSMAAREIGNLFLPALNAIIPYAIAVAKVIRYVANAIGQLFGVEAFSDKEYSTDGLTSGAEGIADAYDEAAKSAKEFKSAMLGIDELNVISPPTGSSSGSGTSFVGAGFDFELPTYDFLDGLAENRVNEIVEKMKEWLGLTGEITSWADLFDTKLGKIMLTVGAIGTAFGLWKISKELTTGITGLGNFLKNADFKWLPKTLSTKITAALGSLGGHIVKHPVIAGIVGLIAGALALAFTDHDFTGVGKAAGEWIGKALNWLGVDELFKNFKQKLDDGLAWISSEIEGKNLFELIGFFALELPFELLAQLGEVGYDITMGIIEGAIEKWNNFCENMGEFFSSFWEGFCNTFGINSPAEETKPLGRYVVEGIRVGLSEAWDNLRSWWKGLSLPQLYFKTPHFTWSTRAATGTIKKVMDFLNIPARIPSLSVSWYKDGGYPGVGELFVAREAGPEMVGKMGNRTTVANNQQIVEGISEGVYAAVLAAMRQSEGNGPVAVDVYLDGRRVTSSVEKRQHERGATIMRNGVYAY